MAKEVKSQNYPALKRQAFGLIIGLTVQNVLGMATNLFVKFPEGEDAGQSWKFAWSQIPLAAHMIIGIFLLLGSLLLLIRAVRIGDRKWIATSAWGFGSIFISAFEGSTFIPLQKEIFSFIMSVAALTALISYFVAIYLSKD